MNFIIQNSSKNKALFIFVLTLAGCRKDPDIEQNEPINTNGCLEAACNELTPPGPPGTGEVFDDTYVFDGVQYLTPCFNPNNANEFIYTRIGFSPNPELVKYNLQTGVEVVLLNSMSLGRADWGEQGWIIYHVTGGFIWKLKDDGTQNQLVSSQSIGNNPRFGNTGEYFIAMGASIPYTYGDYFPIFDLTGNVVDSSLYKYDDSTYIGYPCHSLDSKFNTGYYLFGDYTSVNNSRIGFCHKTSGTEISELASFLYEAEIKDAAVSSNAIYFTEWSGSLRKIDLNNLNMSIYKAGCSSRYYEYISMSPNADKLLAERITLKRLDYYTVDVQHDLVLFDLNSCDVEVILAN